MKLTGEAAIAAWATRRRVDGPATAGVVSLRNSGGSLRFRFNLGYTKAPGSGASAGRESESDRRLSAGGASAGGASERGEPGASGSGLWLAVARRKARVLTHL